MLGLFQPKLPVSDTARRVVDESLARFTEIWGPEIPREAGFVLPNADFLPAPWAETDEHAQRVLERICGYMRVDPTRVRLQLFREDPLTEGLRETLPYWEGGTSGAAGFYS